MENQKETVSSKNQKNKHKKKGKIEQIWEMTQKGNNVKEINQKTKLSERIAQSYIWRKYNSSFRTNQLLGK